MEDGIVKEVPQEPSKEQPPTELVSQGDENFSVKEDTSPLRGVTINFPGENGPIPMELIWFNEGVNFSVVEWVQTLKRLPEFTGNIENTAFFMKRMSDGVRKATQMIRDEGNEGFKPPVVSLVRGEGGNECLLLRALLVEIFSW